MSATPAPATVRPVRKVRTTHQGVDWSKVPVVVEGHLSPASASLLRRKLDEFIVEREVKKIRVVRADGAVCYD